MGERSITKWERAYVVSATWRELEPAPGTFDLGALFREAAYAEA